MRHMTRALIFAMVGLMTTSAVSTASETGWQARETKGGRGASDRTAAHGFSILREDGYLRAARAFLALRGTAPAVPESPALPAVGRRLDDLRADLAEPVAGILAAVEQAERLIGPMTSMDLAKALSAHRATFARWPRRGMSGDDPHALRVPAFAGSYGDSAERGLLLVAAALDRHLDELRAAAAPSSGAADCDVLDETPDLCIASDEDNVHTKNVRLLIDLGGNDTYTNNAGGAPFSIGGTELSPVSVNLDLGGSDRYESPTPSAVSISAQTGFTRVLPVTVAQGAGVASSLGVLIDEGGHDTYTAVAPEPTPEAAWTLAVAQGAGVLGVGALFDGDGNDRYETTAPDGKGSAWITAQASASGPCMIGGGWSDSFVSVGKSCYSDYGGLLRDTGRGDDVYVTDAGEALMEPGDGPTPGVGLPARGAMAQGVAWLGAGLLADDGGRDSMRVAAAADVPGRTSHEKLGAAAIVWGQGVGAFTGVGGIVQGEGPTTYDLSATGRGATMLTEASGQGQAQSTGEGFIDDRSGDDRYTIDASLDWRVERIVEDPCECEAAVLKANGRGGFVILNGQGMAFLESAAHIHDHAGNDTYTASGTQRFDVVLRDRLAQPAEPPSLSVSAIPRPNFFAQGAGRSISSAGLLDDAGNDTYTLTNLTTTSADATSRTFPDVRAVVIPPITGGFLVGGQGAGDLTSTGQLLDRAGAIDRAEASSRVRTVTPDPKAGFQRSSWALFQGAGGGGLISMQGADVVALSHPSRPVCPEGSVRGSGVWAGCWNQPPPIGSADPGHQAVDVRDLGVGAIPNGLEAARPTLEFLPGTQTSFVPDGSTEASEDIPRLHAEIRLTTASGTPVGGAPITLDLQRHCPDNVGLVLWEVPATTDQAGIASVEIPLWQTATWAPVNCQTAPWRLLATYDGREGGQEGPALAPAHAAVGLTTA